MGWLGMRLWLRLLGVLFAMLFVLLTVLRHGRLLWLSKLGLRHLRLVWPSGVLWQLRGKLRCGLRWLRLRRGDGDNAVDRSWASTHARQEAGGRADDAGRACHPCAPCACGAGRAEDQRYLR